MRYEIVITENKEISQGDKVEMAKAETLSFTSSAKIREKTTMTTYLKNVKEKGFLKGSLIQAGATGIVAMQAANTAQATFNFLTSQVGYYSGNYVLQERIDYGMNLAGKIGGIALMSAINPVLGAVALAGEITNQIISTVRTDNKMKVENNQKMLERQRIGISASINRSRSR